MNAVASYHYAQCKCVHCPGQIQFIRGQEGQTVTCPHCQMETDLYLKPIPIPTGPARKSFFRVNLALAIFLTIGIALCFGDVLFWRTGGVGIIGVLVGGLVIYFLPTIIAFQRDHRNGMPILLVNAFFGWTLLGWVGALIWAIYQEKK
jgi:hypothetical protein